MPALLRSAGPALLAALAAAQDDEAFPWFGRRLAEDAWAVATAPTRWDALDWAVAGGCVGGIVAIGVGLDSTVARRSQELRTPARDDAAHTVAVLGTGASLAFLGAAGLEGWLAGDPRGSACLVDGIEASIITSVLVVPLLKFTIGRSRPYASGTDSDTFSPFSADASMPSGHTAQAFTVATVLAASYDWSWPVAVPSYAVAAAVGASRIVENKHYLSDVVAGAVLGTAISLAVVRANQRRRAAWAPQRVALDPVGRSLSLGWSF